MEDFLKFKRMLTPVIIQILFWVGLGVVVLAGLAMMFAGISAQKGGGGMVFAGLLMILLGPIFWRVYCELLIVIFSINDTLTEMRDALKEKSH